MKKKIAIIFALLSCLLCGCSNSEYDGYYKISAINNVDIKTANERIEEQYKQNGLEGKYNRLDSLYIELKDGEYTNNNLVNDDILRGAFEINDNTLTLYRLDNNKITHADATIKNNKIYMSDNDGLYFIFTKQ